MAEIIRCPACQRTLQVAEEHLGKYVVCPECKDRFVASFPGEHRQALTAPPPLPSSRPRDWEDDDWPPRRRYDDDRPRDDYISRRRHYDDDYRDDIVSRRLAPHHGGTVLTCGIVSFFVCTPVLALIAIIMGATDLKEIRAGRMDPSGEGQARGGMICGIVSMSLFLLIILGWLVIAAMVMGTRR